MQPVLEVKDLAVRYGAGHGALTAVDGVSFALPRGTTLGIVGESGCGKSTLAKALVGMVPVVRGAVTVDGVDRTPEKQRTSREYRRTLQMVFQDPHSSLNPRMRIGATLREAVGMRQPLPSREDRRRITADLMARVGLPESMMDRFPHQLSGGQKQRVAIARALAVGATTIIYDEATSALDVSVQAMILNLLRRLQQESNLSYILISHDFSVVRAMSDSVAVMYLGRIVEFGPTDDIFRRPANPYTRALIDSIPSLVAPRRPAALSGEVPDPRKPPSGCRFRTRCPVGPTANADRTICIEVDPADGASTRLHRSACHFAEHDPPAQEPHQAAPPGASYERPEPTTVTASVDRGSE
jgi:peptide/nickel transport system ATP-binding protein